MVDVENHPVGSGAPPCRSSGRRLLAALAAFIALPCLGQSTIELRASACASAPVRLREVAKLSGPEAEALADVLIEPKTPGSVDVAGVREALDRHDADWSRIILRGSTCRLKAPGGTPSTEPEARQPMPEPVSAAEAMEQGTMRAAVAAKVAQILGVPADELRLSFDPKDEDLLREPVAGRAVEVRPLGSSERMPLALAVYEGDRIVVSQTLRVGVEVRRVVAVATVPRRRGDVVAASDVAHDVQWLPPTVKPADPTRVIGACLVNRLVPGQVVTENDMRAPVVIRKGDIVRVRVLSGTIVLERSARARADGRDGEMLDLLPLDSKDPIRARVNGPGRAVVVVGATEDLP